jgi:hypothetical protein
MRRQAASQFIHVSGDLALCWPFDGQCVLHLAAVAATA